MKAIILIAALSSVFLAGCASSPVNTGYSEHQKNARSGLSRGAVYAAGVAGGALAGQSVSDSDLAAPAGAVVGLGVSHLVNRSLDKRANAVRDEAYEQGKRDARLEVMRHYWDAASNRPDSGGKDRTETVKTMRYNSGTYDGVNMLPREEEVPAVRTPFK